MRNEMPRVVTALTSNPGSGVPMWWTFVSPKRR